MIRNMLPPSQSSILESIKNFIKKINAFSYDNVTIPSKVVFLKLVKLTTTYAVYIQYIFSLTLKRKF